MSPTHPQELVFAFWVELGPHVISLQHVQAHLVRGLGAQTRMNMTLIPCKDMALGLTQPPMLAHEGRIVEVHIRRTASPFPNQCGTFTYCNKFHTYRLVHLYVDSTHIQNHLKQPTCILSSMCATYTFWRIWSFLMLCNLV